MRPLLYRLLFTSFSLRQSKSWRASSVLVKTSWISDMISLAKYLNQTGYQSYAQHVPEHWLHQAAPDPNVQAAIGWIAIMISVPAQICQALVICVFYR